MKNFAARGEDAKYLDLTGFEVFLKSDYGVFLIETVKWLGEVKSPWKACEFAEKYDRGRIAGNVAFSRSTENMTTTA